MNKRKVIILILIVFLLWNFLTLFLFWSKTSTTPKGLPNDLDSLNELVENLREKAQKQQILQDHLLKLFNLTYKAKVIFKEPLPRTVVLVLCCNRPYVKQIIQKVLSSRPKDNFPVLVSQDCIHRETKEAIDAFADKITYIQQPNQTDFVLPHRSRHMQGYYRISRHYKFALNHAFNVLQYDAAIIVEDDLDISPDFFEYFSSTLPLLMKDPTLWCVSAWNDNGKENFIDPVNGPSLLYRTDFFPGLGWMLTKNLWNELSNKWPQTYWDDWMRQPQQRKGRACIRPEIPRTSTFGKRGVSLGQFYEKHLKYIKHYDGFFPFTKTDLSYLMKNQYDISFFRKVYNLPILQKNELVNLNSKKGDAFRIEYRTNKEFSSIAKTLAIMDDLKSNVPRMGYGGVVSVMYNSKRIYLSPSNASYSSTP